MNIDSNSLPLLPTNEQGGRKRQREEALSERFDPFRGVIRNNGRGGQQQRSIVKSAQVYSNYDDKGIEREKLVRLNGVEYPVKLLGHGKYHKVFEFTGSKKVCFSRSSLAVKDLPSIISIVGEMVAFPPESIVLKMPNLGERAPNKISSDQKRDQLANEEMVKTKIPSPMIYVDPKTFHDLENKRNGGFWILEKMDSKVDLNDKTALTFARDWLTRSAKEERELIGDFYPRNVMKKDGNFYVVDPTLKEEDDCWLTNLYGFLIGWSNGNKENYNFLTSDFPKSIAEKLSAMLEKEIVKNGGLFPTK